MPELGKTLSQARVARGLTLEDCERDTRISKRYLDALEREDWRIFPAPVYSRAFLRTYAQYLGLDPQALMRAMQTATAEEPAIKPLPEIRPAPATGAMNWPLAGGVLVLILIAGLFVWLSSRGGDDDGALATEASNTATNGGEALGGGPRPGRPVGEVEKGVVPDLSGVSVEAALDALTQAELDFVVVETDAVEGTPGIVASQDPAPGTDADGDTSVTLVVPRG
jgi:transcriptional regulator with XRE-family HTH domain